MRKISNSNEEVEVIKTYTDEVIKNRIGKYGAVYFPLDIQDNIDDILGNEVKKEIT